MKKRMLSLLLALTLIVGMLPLSALTATAASAKHYEVDNWGELRTVLEWDSGSTPITITLTADIYEETPNVDLQKDEGDEEYDPFPTVQIVGNKTLDLNGYRIEVNDKSNYRCYVSGGIVWTAHSHASENTLFNVTADASLTINDATGKGNITFTGHMISEWTDYEHYCVRDIFEVEGTLTLNGGTIEAGRSKKQWFTDEPLDPTGVSYSWSRDEFEFSGYEDTHTGSAYQQIWGTAVTMKGKGTFIMNGGTLYGRGSGQYINDEKIRENNDLWGGFKTIRDEVIQINNTAKVYINNGNVYAKGGANIFGGTWFSQHLVIKYGIFETDTVDYIRSLEIYPVRVGLFYGNGELITSGTEGVMNVYEEDWKKDLDNVIVTINGTAYTTLEEKQALDLHDVSGTVILAPVAEDGFPLAFVSQNPMMPVGYDNWSLWQEYGKTTTFTFNHIPLTAQQVKDGYYVERNYVIRNAANKQVMASGSGILGTGIVNVTHSWNEVGTFTFIEDLTLKDKTGAKVKSEANTFNIYVQPAVDHIEITTPPTQTTCISQICKTGDYYRPSFDGKGMVVTAYYTDGTTEDVTKYVDFSRSLAFDATQNAISYTDAAFEEEHFAFQPVTVEKAYEISITDKGGAAYANERMYYAAEGTKLDLINTRDYDKDLYQLDGWTVTRDDNGEAVEVHEYINGGSYYFIMPDTTVTIEPILTLKKVVESIQIQTPPAKTDYYEGQEFNPAGMALRVFYTDGTWEDIKDEALRPYLHFHESIATGISRYLKLSDTAVFVQFNKLTACQSINVTKSTGIYSIELTMDGYGYGKNVADFTVSLDTDHIRFTEAGNITDGFDLDRWNGSSSTTVTSGIFDIYEYDLSIAIQLDAGYTKQFTADTVTVNGIKARSVKSVGSGKYIIGFALPNFIVSEVNLTVADPSHGMTPNDFKVVIPGGSYYTFAGTTQWTAWHEKTQTDWTLSSDGQFVAGVKYSTTLTLEPVDGFVFEDTWYELSATINGEAATITRNSNGTVSVNYSVVIPENPPATLISNITSYVDEYVNVTVELYKRGETTPAYTEMVRGTTDNPALVVISGIEDGTYTMQVDKPYHKTYTSTITAAGNTIYADVELEATSFFAVFHFGSDPIAWQEVAKGEKVIKPEDPALEGKIFTGWYTADGQLYNFNTSVTDNVNLYARFDHDIDIDLSGDINVNCVGKINYTVSGQTVTVNHSLACKVGYLSGGSYVAIAATKNGDSTYSFTAPAGVTEVVLLVKGDVSGDGRINVGDTAKLYSHVRGTAKLTDPIAIFAADVSGDGKLNVGDTAKVYSHVKATALLTW